MLTGLLCLGLGTAWAGGDPLANRWSGEYDTPGNLSILVAPLRLTGYENMGPRMRGTRVPAVDLPTIDLSIEFRAGESQSFAITGATSLTRGVGIADDLAIETPQGNSSGNPGSGESKDREDPSLYGPTAARTEVGLQVRDYVVGGFDSGLFLGGHARLTNPKFLYFRADRATLGPMVGLKVTASIFTVELKTAADFGFGKGGFTIWPRVDFATGLTF